MIGRTGRVSLALGVVLGSLLVHIPAEGGSLAKEAAKAAAQKAGREAGMRQASKEVLRRDALRDRATRPHRLEHDRTAFRFTSKARQRKNSERVSPPTRT